jgi:hypothetical protein
VGWIWCHCHYRARCGLHFVVANEHRQSAFSFQTWRNGSGPIIAYPFALYRTGGQGDDYGIYSFVKYSANMSGFNGGANEHGMRSYLILNPSNVGANSVNGYSLWAQAQRLTAGNVRAVGAQIDTNNDTSSDAEYSSLSSPNTTFAIATNGGGENIIPR